MLRVTLLVISINLLLTNPINNMVVEISPVEVKTVDTWTSVDGIVTAYSPYDDVSGIESEGDPSCTSIGIEPGPTVFAVDPELIPYDSEMEITYADGTVINGIAGDTGGALRESGEQGVYHIDRFLWTYDETIEHGVREVKIKFKENE